MDRLFTLFCRHYGHECTNANPLTGSASNRQYFRLSDGQSSCIGVIGLSASENKAFISMAAHFKSKGIPVPEVYSVSEDGMAYIQEDIGDDTLFKKSKGEDSLQLLCKAVRLLPDIQFKGAEA